MGETEITLKNLFALPKEGIREGTRSAVESSHGIPLLKENLSKRVKGLRWNLVVDDILHKLEELLDVPLGEVIASAWRKSEILAKYVDSDQYPPDETILVPLAEHTVKSEHHPYVEVLIKQQPLGKIVFDVAVVLTLNGFVLKIQDAKIKAIQTGSFEGKGTIALAETVLIERVFDPISLPGSIGLGEGVSLRE